jgi:hypothetical protein
VSRGRNLAKPHSVFLSLNFLIIPKASTKKKLNSNYTIMKIANIMHAKFIVIEQTLNSKVIITYLIIHKKFEASINFQTEREFFCLSICQVNGDVTSPIHFLVPFGIEIQPPEKEDKLLDEAKLNNVIEYILLRVEH